MIVFLLYILVSGLAALLVGLILYARWNYGSLEKTGIPVVKPHFFLGSTPDGHNLVLHEDDMRKARKYGKVWGVYEGRYPHVYIADPELIRLITVKDFDHFHDRRQTDFGHELVNEMLDVLPGEKWKTMRGALTPAFTTGKIRAMSDEMKNAVADCVKNIEQHMDTNQVMNMKEIYTILTVDVVARCAFGTRLDSVNDPKNVFVRQVKHLNQDEDDPNYLAAYVSAFPFLAKTLPFLPPEVLNFFGGVLSQIMKTRREQNIKQNDLVDVFNDLMERVPTEEFQRLGITETTIKSQAVLFVLVGFDTTATTLTMLTYRLAKNPDKQAKLIEELDAVYLKNNGEISHDTLVDLPYLNACINESLRLCPPLIRIERKCQKDWTHAESGLTIKKGTTVQIPAWAVHYNEEYYENPEEFLPERFLSSKAGRSESASAPANTNPYAFLSFGQGLRNCAGSRFAKEEINLTLATILKDFRFEATPETKLQFKKGRPFMVQYEPVHLRVVRREKSHAL